MPEVRRERAEDQPASVRRRLVITIHGIRTFGEWQSRLEDLIDRVDTNGEIHVFTVKYGYFSVFAFLFPFARYVAAWRIRKEIWRKIEARRWRSIDIVAHSFGTYLVAHSVKSLQKKNSQLRIRTIILAGSVLHPRFPWNQLLMDGERPCVKRVVNDCGTKDGILILSQLLVPFSSMAGRVGFQGGLDLHFRNRYFAFGHSGYFVTRGKPNDFMKEWWLPLLLEDKPIPPHESTETTAPSGPKTFLINHAEVLKQGTIALVLYYFLIFPLYNVMQSEKYFRVETSKLKLLRDGENHLARDYRLLAALELNRRDYWNDAESIFRKELAHTPRVHAVLDLQPGERPVSVSINAKYLATFAAEDSKLRVREVPTGEIVSLRKVPRSPTAFVVRPDGTAIAAGLEGNTVWTLAENGVGLEHQFPDSPVVEEVVFSDDSKHLAAWMGSVVHVWNLPGGTNYSLQHDDLIVALNFSPNGEYLVTFIHNDEFVYMHELGSDYSTKIATRANPLDWRSTLKLHHVLASDHGKYVAGVGERMLHVWGMETGDKIFGAKHEQDLEAAHTRQLFAFDRLATSLVTASIDGAVTRWAIRPLTLDSAMRHMKIQGNLFKIIQAEDERFLFVGQRGSRVVFWEETDWIGEHEERRCSDEGELAATLHKDGRIRVWGANGYPLLASMKADSMLDFALSQTHRTLTVLHENGAVTVAPFSDPIFREKIGVEEHKNLRLFKSSLSPNGEFAAFALGDGRIWLWDVHASSVVADVWVGAKDSWLDDFLRVSDLHVGCDGQAVRIQGQQCSEDRNECEDFDRQWQVASDELIGAFGWDDGCQRKSERRLCSYISYEHMPKEMLVHEARRRISRNFTQSEWQSYFGEEAYVRTDPSIP